MEDIFLGLPQEIGGAETRDIGDASIDEVPRASRGPVGPVGGGGKDLCLGGSMAKLWGSG